jgi:hypothetical protein
MACVYITKQADQIFWEESKYWWTDRVSEGEWITPGELWDFNTSSFFRTEVGMNTVRLTAATK